MHTQVLEYDDGWVLPYNSQMPSSVAGAAAGAGSGSGRGSQRLMLWSKRTVPRHWRWSESPMASRWVIECTRYIHLLCFAMLHCGQGTLHSDNGVCLSPPWLKRMLSYLPICQPSDALCSVVCMAPGCQSVCETLPLDFDVAVDDIFNQSNDVHHWNLVFCCTEHLIGQPQPQQMAGNDHQYVALHYAMPQHMPDLGWI